MSEFIEVEEVVERKKTSIEELVAAAKYELQFLIEQIKEQRERVG